MLEAVLQDLKLARRRLVQSPGFALTAILAAALGIGATTAVFSVVDRILFRPLPYPHEDRLVSVGMVAPLDTSEFMFTSQYFGLRRDPGPFEAVTSFQAGALACDLSTGEPLRLSCLRTEASFLQALGLSPFLGRSFTPEEDLPNGPRVALLSYNLWRARFAGDPGLVGRAIPIDGAATTIVGVLPQNFEMPTLTRADLLLPLALNEATERGAGRALRVFARLKPDVTVPGAIAELQPHFARALETVPARFRKEIGFRVRPVRDRQVGDARLASLALFGSVLAVLLIACANIANLLLARAVARDHEFAVRAALGASRLRLMTQTLAESLLLGAAGGAAGCFLAWALLRAFVAIAPGGLPRLEQASLDLRVLLFAVATSLIAGLLFGIAPALRSPRESLAGGWRIAGPARDRLRSALVGFQIAVSMVLLAAAGLLLSSLGKLQRVPLGIQTENVVTAQFILGRERYSRAEQQIGFFRELEERLAALPGIEAAAISDSLPPSGAARFRPLTAIDVEGRLPRPEGTGGMVTWRYVTPGYFAALGIPIARGRAFTERDRDPNTHAIVFSQLLARQLFPDEDALGKRVLRGPQGQWFTVVGIAADVKNSGPAMPTGPEYYLLRKLQPDFTFQSQEPPTGWRAGSLIARTAIPPALVAASIRAAVASLDPTLPLAIETMPQRVAAVTARPRFNAWLLAAFAAMAVLVAAFGLFGTMSLLVAQRTREIGVRMALGATPGRILRSTLQQALGWTAAGLLAGPAGTLAVTRALRALLFQVEPADPRVLAASLVLLSAVAMLAVAIPARRAARLDPCETLRQE